MKVVATAAAIVAGGFAIGVIGGLQLRPAASESLREVIESVEPPQSGSSHPKRVRSAGDALLAFGEATEIADLYDRRWEFDTALEDADASECYELLSECDPTDELALQAVTERWASIDPDGLLKFLLSTEGVKLRETKTVYRELFKTWCKSDPGGAVAAVKDLKPRLRDPYQRHIIGHLLYSDPELAIQVAADTRSVGHGLDNEFADWSDDNPAGAAGLLLSLPRCNFKTSAARTLAQRWGESDPAAALNFAQQLEPVVRERAEESVIRGWISRDPEGAQSYVDAMTGGSLARVGKNMAASLATSDPTSAMTWIDDHLTGKGRSDAIAEVLKVGATQHPDKTAAVAAELPPGAIKNEALEKSLRSWYRQNPDEALNWADSLDDGHEKELAAKTLMSISRDSTAQ